MPRTVHPMKRVGHRKPSSRGLGDAERSKSGGAVRGKIPWPGGTNSTKFGRGPGFTVSHKGVKPAPKPARQRKAKHI